MNRVAGLILILALLSAGYLGFWPVPIDPVAYEAPPRPSMDGILRPNDALGALERLPAGGVGPEDVALGPDGALFAGLADGRIVRIDRESGAVTEAAVTGGRPLGLGFHPNGTLIVADAVKGLLEVADDGTVRVLTNTAGGEPMLFVDDLDIAADGVIWFSDASRRFNYAENLLEFFEGRPTGRLLSFDPASGETKVHLDDLGFANGVALARDESFVLVNETMFNRVTRLWLTGDKAGIAEPFAEGLPGYPDNLSYDGYGRFWVALASPRSDLLDSLADKPWARKLLFRLAQLPGFNLPVPEAKAAVLALNGNGQIITYFAAESGGYHASTSVNLFGDSLYLGSLTADAVGRFKLPPESFPAPDLPPTDGGVAPLR